MSLKLSLFSWHTEIRSGVVRSPFKHTGKVVIHLVGKVWVWVPKYTPDGQGNVLWIVTILLWLLHHFHSLGIVRRASSFPFSISAGMAGPAVSLFVHQTWFLVLGCQSSSVCGCFREALFQVAALGNHDCTSNLVSNSWVWVSSLVCDTTPQLAVADDCLPGYLREKKN